MMYLTGWASRSLKVWHSMCVLQWIGKRGCRNATEISAAFLKARKCVSPKAAISAASRFESQAPPRYKSRKAALMLRLSHIHAGIHECKERSVGFRRAKEHSKRNERHPGILRGICSDPIIGEPLFQPLLKSKMLKKGQDKHSNTVQAQAWLAFARSSDKHDPYLFLAVGNCRQVAIKSVVVAPFCHPPSGQSSEVLQPNVSLLSLVR